MDFSAFLETNSRTVEFEAGQHVFMQGDRDRSLYLVQEGLLKAYYVSEEGREAVKSFIVEQDFIGSLSSIHKAEPCTFNLICLEPSVLLKIDSRALYEQSRQHLEIATRMIDFLISFSMKKERREMEFLNLSAEERYQLLVAQSPRLLETVSQKDIARYLGITPVALSRIKNRSKNKNKQ